MPISSVQTKAPEHTIIEIPDDTPSTTPVLQRAQSFNSVDTYHTSDRQRKSPIEDGMAIGFIAGSCLSIIGIPVMAVQWAEAEKRISKTTSDNLTQVLVPFTFPGLLVGLAAGIVGAVVGGVVSLCQKIHHAVKKHNHDM